MHERTTLPNGLRILTVSMPHTRSVSLSIYVGAGSRYEQREQAGLSHFVEHMLFKGTSRRPTAREISEAVDSVGGLLNGGTDRELTVYYVKVARPHFELAADILLDMIRRPLCDAAEVEKERSVILEELRSVADSPAQQAEVLLDELVFPDQPLGWDVAGFEATVMAVERDAVVDYFHRQYVPNNIVISVAGNISHAEVVDVVAKELGDWEPGEPASWYPATGCQEKARLALKAKRTEQAHISMALRGYSSRHPDRYAVDLYSIIVGEGMSSRLFMELREKRSLCYDVHSYTSKYLDTGTFNVYAGVDPKKVNDAVSAVLEELARTRDGIPEPELIKAKELTKGRTFLRMEDTRNVSGWIGMQELLFGKVRSVDDVIADVERVSTDDLRRVANEVLRPDQLSVAIVGPYRSERRFASLLNF
ncbi:MAG: M16 family metallopeptidase [Dehalococcoidia bacterium]